MQINHELKAGAELKKIHIITTSDFDSGSVWDPVEIVTESAMNSQRIFCSIFLDKLITFYVIILKMC